MKKRNIIISLALAALMVFTMFPLAAEPVFAEDALGTDQACSGHETAQVSGVPACTKDGKLHICENNFPDPTFRGIVKDIFGLNDDYLDISLAETAGKEFSIYNCGIYDLTGIEFFKGITHLSCSGNTLKTLNVSNNTNLVVLDCASNLLSELDVSKNTKLEQLYCYGNSISSVDLSGNPKIITAMINSPKDRTVKSGKSVTFTADAVADKFYWVAVYKDGNEYSEYGWTDTPTVTFKASYKMNGAYVIIYCFRYERDENGEVVLYDGEPMWEDYGAMYAMLTVTDPLFSDIELVGLKDKVYTGKYIKPVTSIKLGTKTLKSGTDYTITYKNNKSVGKATVTVKGKGKYSGKTVTRTFKIVPKGTSISSVKSLTNSFKVTWKKQSTQTTGYQIQYSYDSDFWYGVKTVTVKSSKTTSKTVKGLDSKADYYVRVRTYKTVKGVKYYSKWSAVKMVTTK